MFSLSNICILCLDSKNLSASTKEVEEKLHNFLSENIHFKTNIPKYICTNCLKIINKAHKFKQRCLQSIAIINKYLDLLATNNQTLKKLSIDLTDRNEEFRGKRSSIILPEIEIKKEIEDDVEVTGMTCLLFADPTIEVKTENEEEVINAEDDDPLDDSYCADSDCSSVSDISKSSRANKRIKLSGSTKKPFLRRYLLLLNQKGKENQQNNATTNEIHKDSGKNKCQVCNNEFTEEWMLHLHSIQHKELEEWSETEEMDAEDDSIDKENREGFRLTEKGRYKCTVCKRSFFTLNNLRYHIFGKHKSAVQCKKCNKMLPNQEKLLIHEIKHKHKRPFLCEVCHRGFADSEAFERHKKVHSDLNYDCDQCEKKFFSEDLLKKHKMIHEKSFKFVCETCGKGFRRRIQFEEHLAAVHTGEKKYGCDECSLKFATGKMLHRHQLKHSGEMPFQCDICDKKFLLHYQLKNHKYLRHSDEKPFKCVQCNKAFKLKANLEAHSRTHTGIKAFKCHICKKKLVSPNALSRHIMIHEGIKPFKCQKCDYATVNSSNLKMHERVHDNIKPFKCDKCDYSTGNRSNLKVHAKQHEKGDVKPKKIGKKRTRQSKRVENNTEMHKETIFVGKLEELVENSKESIVGKTESPAINENSNEKIEESIVVGKREESPIAKEIFIKKSEEHAEN